MGIFNDSGNLLWCMKMESSNIVRDKNYYGVTLKFADTLKPFECDNSPATDKAQPKL